MSVEEEIEQISARYPSYASIQQNSALQQQYIERDLGLLIRSVIRDNINKAVIDSFQALSLDSANDKDALVVETIIGIDWRGYVT
jgi:hypothetical protein